MAGGPLLFLRKVLFEIHHKIERANEKGFLSDEEKNLLFSNQSIPCLSEEAAENLFVCWLSEDDKSLSFLADKFSLPKTVVLATWCYYDFFEQSIDVNSIEKNALSDSVDLNLRLAAYVASKKILRQAIFSRKNNLRPQDITKILDRDAPKASLEPTPAPLKLSAEDRKQLMKLVSE